MPEYQSLSELQQRLDKLRPGEAVLISRKVFNRFFGADNDVAWSRLQHFADGHNCSAVWTRPDLKLIKNAAPRSQ